ncbi:TonB-dependent receptor [Sphingomonas sp. BN140010]|uniref:TonB-dependent receptor n=1 Tax=Sphingomonas arvum TaxID=2992113 RepID=A0ABT3JI85_9SPHN|nr:TonB-dependent receptor [Sphingomonas sp. BN140010]MCW3798765.1 TonB-dependent receptor [Sphingomonas sp. BN140010]
MKKTLLLTTCALAVFPTTAYAQSTGTTTTEESATVVVTGTRNRGVGGVVVPDVPKTRSILTNEVLVRQSEGQSILQSINLVPGVNFTNTDPYGSSGGNLRIRGFPGNRVALLFDGLPLNDTGNYAIFSNQQMDQEIIDQVSVNLGTTDVDSPTPSAAGGVVSYRTRVPSTDFSGLFKAGFGSFDFHRYFAMIDTGEFTSFGTRAFIAGSDQRYDKFKGPGQLRKRQANARIYQPLGTSGDFASIAVHYNYNRNNSYNNGLVSDYLADRNFDNIEQCARDIPTAGVADNDGSTSVVGSSVFGLAPSTCTNYYNLRINPSNTGNVRGQLRLTLAPGLIFTADPGYQFTLANGGGTTTINERDNRLRGATTQVGVDLNGDGDTLDTVRLYQPSNTRTNRYTLLSSLVYEISPQHRVRVAYTFDRGHHRQTGEFGFVDLNGNPLSVFGGKKSEDARVTTADGLALQNRDRLSIAQLQQLSFEYFGRFLNDKLTFTAGLRAPWFKRELNQYCYTSNGSNTFGGTGTGAAGGASVTAGNPYCTSNPNPILPGFTATNPQAGLGTRYFAPFERTVKYSPLLPSAGASYDFSGGHSVYVSYGKNFSSPSTDNLYRSVVLDPTPETTNSYELGYRFRSGRLQAQLASYYVDYKNRIVTAQDLDPNSPTFGSTVDRNVGDAKAYGLDGQVSYRPVRDLSLYVYASYIKSKLAENILGPAGNTACLANTTSGSTCVFVLTKGAEFVETPKWTFGGRVQKNFGPLSLGVQTKYVSKRFSTDDNGRVGTIANVGNLPIDNRGRTDAYTTVDGDLRYDLGEYLKNSSVRFSVINLFDKYYFGNINTQNTLSGGPRFSVGAPRTFQATLALGF